MTSGEHKLTVEIRGANEKAMKERFFVGIDQVFLEQVKP